VFLRKKYLNIMLLKVLSVDATTRIVGIAQQENKMKGSLFSDC
jgi:hypothetical protein